MCKVSVVIPVYNVEQYIEECLQSVIHQTLKDIEIICVDDGTPDHSMDIVERYAACDLRIVIVHKQNGGLSSARNAGLEIAKGKYIYFIDSDDLIKENTLQKLYEISENNNLDHIFFGASSFFENETVLEKNRNYIDYYDRSGEYTGIYTGQELFYLWDEFNDFRPSACLQMVRKDFLKKNHISFYEGIVHEDNLFTLHNIMLARRVMCLPDKFYMRRVHEGSIMTVQKDIANSFGYFITVIEFFKLIESITITEEFEQAVLKWMIATYDNALNKMTEIEEYKFYQFFHNYNISIKMSYLVFVKKIADQKKEDQQRYLEISEKMRILEKNDNSKNLMIENENLRQQLADVQHSQSFKVGSILMFIPSKCKKILLYIRKNGWKRTCQVLKIKLAGR